MSIYPQGQSGNILEDLRRRVYDIIQHYLGNDPLEPWLWCIRWLKELCPPGSVQSVLQEVLAACTQTFVADINYKSDLRYLRVWIQYADCCTEPGAIFPFLEANGIGLEHGLFYEAYATLLEVCRDFPKANDVYEIGISRQAQPLERLKSMYRSFCNRMDIRHGRTLREEQKPVGVGMIGGAEWPLSGNEVPAYIGHKTNENAIDKTEMSFEEARLLHWTQNQTQKPDPSFLQTSAGLIQYKIEDPISFSTVATAPGTTGVFQTLKRRPEERKNYRFNTEIERIKEKSTISNFSQDVSFYQSQFRNCSSSLHKAKGVAPVLTSSPCTGTAEWSSGFLSANGGSMSDNRFSMENTVKIQETSNLSSFVQGAPYSQAQLLNLSSRNYAKEVAPLQTSLPSAGTCGGRPSLVSAHGGVTTVMGPYKDKLLVMGLESNANDTETFGHNGLLDPTIHTKIATGDILSMFSCPLACEKSAPRAFSFNYIDSNVSKDGTPEARFQVYVDNDHKSPHVMIRKPQRDSFSVPRYEDSPVTITGRHKKANSVFGCMDSKKLDVFVDPELTISAIEKQSSLSTVPNRFLVLKDMKSAVSAIGTQGSCSQEFVSEDIATPVARNESLQVSEIIGPPVRAQFFHQEAGESKLSSPLTGPKFIPGVIEQQSGAFMSSKLSPVREDTKSAVVGKWSLREISCNSLVGTSSSGVGLRQDLNISFEKEINDEENVDVRSGAGTSPSLSGPLRSIWFATVENGQHVSREDEVGTGDSGQRKRPRVHLSPDARVGGNDAESVELKMDGLKGMQDTQLQPCPIQDLGLITLNGCSTSSHIQRNILEVKHASPEARNLGGKAQKVYPWDAALISTFLEELNPPLAKYKGYLWSTKKYSGKVSITSLKSGVKNKILELGCFKYHLRGCTGRGAFAQVYLAEVVTKNAGNGHRIVLKIQKPACPWEFYIYRQLDFRVSCEEVFAGYNEPHMLFRPLAINFTGEALHFKYHDKRGLYGRAQSMHVYADCSFMACDFGEHGTLQDVVNAYLAKGQRMDEVLCIYYTIEMLRMLENLHKVGLIHGDFKPDNLLIRNTSENLGDWSLDRPGCWKHQGVCLIDWGRSIDTSLFPEGTEFVGDSKTDGFRCTEMLEKMPWTFQVDTFGLCGVVHCLLHGSYMEIEKISVAGSQSICRPKLPYKRYWNIGLWQNFFHTLLNLKIGRSHNSLSNLRKSFEDYLQNTSGLAKKLRQLMMKQNTMLLSRK